MTDGQLHRDWEREQASGSDTRPIGYTGLYGKPLYTYMDEMPEPVYDDMTGELQVDGEHWRAGLFNALRGIANDVRHDGRRDSSQSGWSVSVQRMDHDIMQSAGVLPMFTVRFDSIQHAAACMDQIMRAFGSTYQFVGSDYAMHRLSLAHQMIELLGTASNLPTEADYHNAESLTDDICTFRGDAVYVDGFLFVIADN